MTTYSAPGARRHKPVDRGGDVAEAVCDNVDLLRGFASTTTNSSRRSSSPATACQASNAEPSGRACFGGFAANFAQDDPASGQLVSQAAPASIPFGGGMSQLPKRTP